MKSDVQALVNEVKSVSGALNILREDRPRGEEVAMRASGRIPCDKKEKKICEYCKDMVIELSEVKLELS
jgi:hypothetical protein